MAVPVVDDLVDVPLRAAARAVNVDERRVRAWTKGDLLMPRLVRQHGHRRYLSFRFEDLMQAGVIAELERRGASLREIRRLVAFVREYHAMQGQVQVYGPAFLPLIQLEWGIDRDTLEVFVRYPDGGWAGGRSPGQGVMVQTINLEEIKGEVRHRLGARAPEDVGRITRVRGVHGSKPVFAGTRTPVASVVQWLDAGASVAKVLEAYPQLEPADVEAARAELV